MDRRAIGAARVHPDGSGKSADWAICSVDHAMPGLSARDGLARWQARALACAVLCTLAGALAAPTATLLIVFALSSAFFLGVVVLRLAAVTTALVSVPRSEPEQERETDLPVYTLLVPLYREASVVPRLLAALEGLDYPRPKLDAKLLLEADDDETIRALNACALPAWCEIVTVTTCSTHTPYAIRRKVQIGA